MKILITGCSGFIGKSLYKSLCLGNEVYCMDKVFSDGLDHFIAIDLLKPERVEALLKENDVPQMDVIIHCASILATSDNHEDMDLLYKNLKIVESAIAIAKILCPKKLINFSTIGVYSAKDGSYTEESFIKPSDNYEALYDLSKFCSEELFSFMLKNTPTDVVNMRVSQTIGLGMRKDRIYTIMLDELKRTNKVSVWGNGERISAFITIEYLINTIKSIILKDGIEGTFNIGEKNMSYYQLAKDIIHEFGNSESEILLIDKGKRTRNYIDFTKINQALIQ